MATVTKRKGSYFISVSCGYDINVKQARQTMTWTPEPKMTDKQIKKELDRQKALFEEAVRNGQVINKDIKFETFAKQWLEQIELEKNIKETTLSFYKSLQPRIYAVIGHLKLSDISSGTDVKTVSASLGHSQTSTTLNIYAYSFAEQQAQANEAVAEKLTERIIKTNA